LSAFFDLILWLMVSFLRVLFVAPRTTVEGHSVLVLPRFFGLLGVAGVLGGVAIPLSVMAENGAAHVGLAWLGLLFFTVPGLYLVLGTYVHQVTLTPTTTLRWSQIQTVRFHELSQQVVLSDGTRHVRCHVYLRGFERLGQTVSHQMGQPRAELTLPWSRPGMMLE
jgi:hypothetical protein